MGDGGASEEDEALVEPAHKRAQCAGGTPPPGGPADLSLLDEELAGLAEFAGVAELEEARRDSIAREFFARHSPGVALAALAVPSRASDGYSDSLEEDIPGAGFYSAAGTAANWSPTSHHTAKCSPGAQFSPMAQRW